ncbi:MAG TPA: helix-turn-helix domain-containing protein [Sporichthyaceae bacterium]|jgi:DNA-binding HxlR family transcriptional regulator|nr:helix-turn-helix domain-containing protein [Sporichthyaceae bacterium]
MDLDSTCAISRSLAVLGERWTMLILREALAGTTRFADFRDDLGVASDILTDRLVTLVEYGALTKEPYQEVGARTRYEYRLTPAGRELQVVLGALQQWGDEHLAWPDGPSVLRRDRRNDRPLHVGFVDDRGREVALDNVAWVRTAVYPT